MFNSELIQNNKYICVFYYLFIICCRYYIYFKLNFNNKDIYYRYTYKKLKLHFFIVVSIYLLQLPYRSIHPSNTIGAFRLPECCTKTQIYIIYRLGYTKYYLNKNLTN